jgi:hypothetical protein
MSTSQNKPTIESAYRALISATGTEYGPNDTFLILGQTLPQPALISRFQKRLEAAIKTAAMQASYRGTVQEEHTVNAEVAPVRSSFKSILVARYGKDSPKLLEFGYQPSKKAKRSVASKTVAVAKGKATRVARNTQGKVQKSKTKGAVGATVEVSTTSGSITSTPTASTPPNAPAANPSPGGGNGASPAAAVAAPARPGGPAQNGG